MRSLTTIEPKKHGDSLFPFASYNVRYPKNSVILDLHWHSQLEFLVVTEGAGIFVLDDREIRLQKGEGVVVGSGILHRGSTDVNRTCSFTALVFDPGLISGNGNDRIKIKYIDPVLNYISYTDPFLSPREVEQVIEISKIAEKSDIGYELDIKIGILNIFKNLYIFNKSNNLNSPKSSTNIKESDKSKNIKEALLFIHRNYNKEITLSQIAKVAGMSEAHFSRTFKLLVDKTVFEYIHFYRINSSIELLKNSSNSVSLISQKVGFESSSYFIKRFKAITGKTPREYRKESKGEII